MVEEYESLLGRECVARICSPVRMCHPMSKSARGRFDRGPASNDQKRKTKIMSRTEGSRKRWTSELDGSGVIRGVKKKCIGFLCNVEISEPGPIQKVFVGTASPRISIVGSM